MTERYKPPFFVLGNPRSGTSLLRLMLHSHPQLCVPPECGFMEWWYEKYSGWKVDFNSDSSRIEEYITDLLSSKKIETWGLDAHSLKENIRKLNPGSYAELTSSVYLTFARIKNKKKIIRWGDKNNYYMMMPGKLHAIYPDAKFILIVRDGRDVACSYLEVNKLKTDSPYKPKLPTRLEDIAREWIANNERVLGFFEGLPSHSWMTLRYEDLLLRPELELSKVCNFLSVSFDAEMLNYPERNRQFSDEPAALMDWKKKTVEKPDASNAGKYRTLLTPEETENFNSIAGAMLRKFGYDAG